MHKVHTKVHPSRSRHAACLFLVCGFVLLALTLSAQAPTSGPKRGIVRQLSEVKFPPGDGPDCLQFFLENGDLKAGPSTAIMKAAPSCVVPPHYHTAEEQLIIAKGRCLHRNLGHARYRSRPRWFRHDAQQTASLVHLHRQRGCLMFATFDRGYDIVWLKPNK